MDQNALTLLAEILDAGNLSLAARRLKMSRANVSYRLKQLETELGVQLVRRTTRRVEPTEIGLALAAHGRAIQQELDAAREAVASIGREPSGLLRVSVPSGYGQMVMSPWLIEFKRRHPKIVLDLRFENRIVDLLGDEVDIALRVMGRPPQNLVARELGPVHYVLCASRKYAREAGMPTSLDELRSRPLLTSGAVGRELRLAATKDEQRQETELAPVLMSEHFPFLREAILAGLGLGLVPDYVVADAIASGEVLTALDDWRLSVFGTTMYLLYMPSRRQTLAMRSFIDFVLERAAARRAA